MPVTRAGLVIGATGGIGVSATRPLAGDAVALVRVSGAIMDGWLSAT